jgi:hypothetical protein
MLYSLAKELCKVLIAKVVQIVFGMFEGFRSIGNQKNSNGCEQESQDQI